MLRYLSFCSGLVPDFYAWRNLPFECVGVAEIDHRACGFLHSKFGIGRPRYMPTVEEMDKTIQRIEVDIEQASVVGDNAAVKVLEKFLKKAVDERKHRRLAIKAVSKIPLEGTLPNLGDITQVRPEDLVEFGTVDFVIAGTPCQSFSYAGTRGGFQDPRGNVTLAYAQLVEHLKENNGLSYCLWENVKGVLDHADNPLGHLMASLAGERESALQPSGKRWPGASHIIGHDGRTVAWRVLDAQFWGVAQTRKRVFALANLAGTDVCPGKVLFERYREDEHPQAGGQAEQEGAGVSAPSDRDVGIYGIVDNETIAPGIMPTVTSRQKGGSMPPVLAVRKDLVTRVFGDVDRGIYRENHKPTIRRSGGDHGGGSEVIVIVSDECEDEYIIRRATPVEVERLFGLPDNWTYSDVHGKPASDDFRYKSLGNSIAVPCLQFLGESLWREHSEVHGLSDDEDEILMAA